MKKAFVLAMLLHVITLVQAQEQDLPRDSMRTFLKGTTIPTLHLLKTDSTWFTNQQIAKNKKLAIIYFNTDCGHCQVQVKDILDSMHCFKQVQFVLVSTKSIKEIRTFSKEYALEKYANIVVARDTEYKLPKYYRIEYTPYIAIYDKGIITKIFTQGANMDTLKPWLQ